MSSEYEDILRELGSFGPYQIRVFILVSMFETPAAWAMLLPVLLADKPEWTCPFVNTDHNMTSWFGGNETYAYDYDIIVYDYNSTNTTRNVCMPGNKVCPGIRFSTEFTSIISEWQLICDQDHIADLITSIQMGGVLVGALITGQLADMFGRRKILYIEYSFLIVVWFSSAFSPSWIFFAVVRFFIGGLIGGVMVVNFVLPIEFVTPQWRTFCGCIGLWAVGLMTLALWGYFIRDWQYLVIGTSLTSIPLLGSWWFVPESPRWLLNKGKIKRAEAILTAMAKFNKKEVPDFSRLRDFAKNVQRQKAEEKKYSYWHLCSNWKLAKYTMIVLFGWFVSSSVYYGLNFNTRNMAGNRYLNIFISGLVEIPALVFVVLVNNRLGRRKTVSFLMLISGVFCFSILFLDLAGKLESLSPLAVTLAMTGKAGISGAWAALQVFSAEIFPTVIRNIGVGACSVAARVGGIVAPQFVYLGKYAKPVPFTIFGCIALVCGFLILLMPETRGVPLPDVLQAELEVTVKVNSEGKVEEEEEEGEVDPEEVPLQVLEDEDRNTHISGVK